MTEWVSLLGQGGGLIAVGTGLAYAIVRMLRQDGEWKAIITELRTENTRLRDENTDLRGQVFDLENDL